MSRLQVVDGRIAHANGFLDLILSGDQRLCAHANILALTNPSSSGTERQIDANVAIGAILKRDPSLLLEPIPNRYPWKEGADETWERANSVWRNNSDWYGNWLTLLTAPGFACYEAAELALAVGIHPDDESIWSGKSLLSIDGWAKNPKRLTLALSHGANPDFMDADGVQGYLRAVLVDITVHPFGDGDKAFEDALECAHLLLDAGARNFDPVVAPSVTGQINFSQRVSTALGLLASGTAQLMDPRWKDSIFRLAERLHQSGADIDRLNGGNSLPPVVQSIRSNNIEFACQLIRMGCKTDDESIKREVGANIKIESLEQEAFAKGGDEFRTKIDEAKMSRRISQSTSAQPRPGVSVSCSSATQARHRPRAL